ncbi:hypothetical protein MKT89_002198 [Staphylococcus pseudintermedius]|nr:hypothetical protein [Staphylococcus pseudintermedius]
MKRTDKSQAKSYLKQHFGTKRYLYQDGRKVAHMHIVNSVYYLHGHANFVEWQGVKKEFNNKRDFDDYLKKHELYFIESEQLTSFFEV